MTAAFEPTAGSPEPAEVGTTEPPGPSGVRWFARLLGAAIVGVLRDFLWVALRDGVIRLRGFSPAMRAVVILASVGLVVLTVSFATGDLFRNGADLLVIPNGPTGRGTLVPPVLVPITFVALSVGCALVLAGALHATVPVRLGVLAFYVCIAVLFQGLADAMRGPLDAVLWPGWVAIAVVVGVFAARWRARPRPAAEFAVLVTAIAVTLGGSAAVLIRADEFAGNSFALQQLSSVLIQMAVLTTPLLYVAGLDIIGFGVDASSWSLRFMDRRVPLLGVLGMVILLGAWRLRDTVVRYVSLVDDGLLDAVLPLVGAVVLVASLWGYWLLLARVAGHAPGTRDGEDVVDHGSAKVRLPLGLAFTGLVVGTMPILLLVQALYFLELADAGAVEWLVSFTDFLGRSWVVTTYRLAAGVALALLGIRVARRGSVTVGLFVGAVGVTDLVAQALTRIPGLDRLFWGDHGPVDAVWVVVFASLGVAWAVTGRLTEFRAERLFMLFLLSALLSQFEFASDPLAPLLGFAGVGFVVFGFVWGFLTGGGWVNEESTRFPRSSRVLLYLGYSVLSIALLNWFAATHDLGQLTRIESTGTSGVFVLGYPLLSALFILLLTGAVVDRPPDVEPDTPPEDARPDGLDAERHGTGQTSASPT